MVTAAANSQIDLDDSGIPERRMCGILQTSLLSLPADKRLQVRRLDFDHIKRGKEERRRAKAGGKYRLFFSQPQVEAGANFSRLRYFERWSDDDIHTDDAPHIQLESS